MCYLPLIVPCISLKFTHKTKKKKIRKGRFRDLKKKKKDFFSNLENGTSNPMPEIIIVNRNNKAGTARQNDLIIFGLMFIRSEVTIDHKTESKLSMTV